MQPIQYLQLFLLFGVFQGGMLLAVHFVGHRFFDSDPISDGDQFWEKITLTSIVVALTYSVGFEAVHRPIWLMGVFFIFGTTVMRSKLRLARGPRWQIVPPSLLKNTTEIEYDDEIIYKIQAGAGSNVDTGNKRLNVLFLIHDGPWVGLGDEKGHLKSAISVRELKDGGSGFDIYGDIQRIIPSRSSDPLRVLNYLKTSSESDLEFIVDSPVDFHALWMLGFGVHESDITRPSRAPAMGVPGYLNHYRYKRSPDEYRAILRHMLEKDGELDELTHGDRKFIRERLDRGPPEVLPVVGKPSSVETIEKIEDEPPVHEDPIREAPTEAINPVYDDPTASESFYPPDWLERIHRVRKRDEYTCQSFECPNQRHNSTSKNTTTLVAHRHPPFTGGNHSLENLITYCQDCYIQKLRSDVNPIFDEQNSYHGKYPPDWEYRRRLVLLRDNETCVECGTESGSNIDGEAVALNAHHRTYLSNGGTNRSSNLVTVCEYCHSDIHGRPVGNLAREAGEDNSRITT